MLIREYELSSDERNSVRQAAQFVQLELMVNGWGPGNCYSIAKTLPVRLVNALESLHSATVFKALLFRNWMNVESVVPTPRLAIDSVPLKLVGTEAYLFIASVLTGEPSHFKGWCQNAMLQNVFPIRRLAHTQSGSNEVALLLHTELPFRPDTPQTLLLLCVRAGPVPRPATLLSNIADAADSLEKRRVLLQDAAYFFTNGDFRTPSKAIEQLCRNGRSHFGFSQALLAEGEHSQVLSDLKAAVIAQIQSVVLETGDLLVLDNTTVCHGRVPVNVKYDGSDRWLQRMLTKLRN